MKKTILMIVVISLITSGLLMFNGGCKRNTQEDPDMFAPSAHQKRLVARAEPSVLYIPQNNQTVSSEISVTAQNNDGTPVLNRAVIFQAGSYGYFDDLLLTAYKNLNDLGRANTTFYIPGGTSTGDTITYLKAILVDNAMFHNSMAEVYDYIPIRLVPYGNQGMLRVHGHVYNNYGDGVPSIPIEVEGVGVTVTRPSGSWDMLIPYGWFGYISPPAATSYYTFIPTEYTYTDPVYTDLDNVDFIAQLTAPATLAHDIPNSTATGACTGEFYCSTNTGCTFTFHIWNSTSTAPIPILISTELPSYITFDVGGAPGNIFTVPAYQAYLTVNITIADYTALGLVLCDDFDITIVARDDVVSGDPIDFAIALQP